MRFFGVVWLVAVLLVGCASSGYRSASGTMISAQSLQDAQLRIQQENIPEELHSYFVPLYSEGRQNSVLHAMRAGLASLRLQRYDLAKRTWDQAIAEIETLQEGEQQARRAKSRFVGEQEKWFKGESYERAALYLYRGLLYLQDQDFNNASACFRRSQLQDIAGEDAREFGGDWVSSDLALAVALYVQGLNEEARNAIGRAQQSPAKVGDFLSPTKETNLLLVVEAGNAPIKYRAGKYGEQLRFAQSTPSISRLLIQVGDEKFNIAPTENLYLQATTRGTRKVDDILSEKATFKQDTETASKALAKSTVASSQLDNSGMATGVLALATLGTMIASHAANPQADIRAWKNLPHSIYLVPLSVKNTQELIRVQGISASGNIVQSMEVQPKDLQDSQLRIAWLRMN